MPSLFEEQPWWTTADNNALSRERDKKLPVRSSFFNALVPQVSAKDAAVNRPILDETQRGQPGVISKLLIGGAANAAETFGMPGVFDPSGDIRNQSWGNALKASAWLPADTAKSAYDAVVDPSRAASGEMSPKGGVYQDELGNYVDETGKPLSEYRDEMLSSGLNIAGTAAMTGSIAPKPRNAAGMFGGRLAKTADHAALARAEELAAKGAPREDIWSQTGWFKGVDGKWRFEIDDSKLGLRGEFDGYPGNNPIALKAKAGDVFSGLDDIWSAYPNLQNMKVNAKRSMSSPDNGAYVPGIMRGELELDYYGPHNIKPLAAHEIQHAVQGQEGFQNGTNPIMAKVGRLLRGDLETSSRDAYQRNSGEAEARAVEKRLHLTPEQRADRPPWLDFDVPEGQQIVGGLNYGRAMSLDTDIARQIHEAQRLANPDADPNRLAQIERRGPYYEVSSPVGNVRAVDVPNGVRITSSKLDPDVPRGMGYGSPLYEILAQEAAAAGKLLASDGIVSKPAQNVYSALSRRGYDVYGPPSSAIKHPDTGQLVANEPIFTVNAPDVPLREMPPSLQPPPKQYTEAEMTDRVANFEALLNRLGSGTDDILYGNGKQASAPGLLAAEAADKPRVPNPIRAYHGSPHDFDKFDLSKIGTGEGAQAYGHGLYFAENEGVAKSYKGSGRSDQALAGRDAQAALAKFGGNRGAAIAALDDQAARLDKSGWGTSASAVRAAADALRSKTETPGRMYEVNIKANPDDFLDWDKPLSQQSDTVQDALKSGGRRYLLEDGNGTGGWTTAAKSPGVAEKLREAGIPGIRYLDQGSRTAGEGSSNYVVFDADLIEILRKYMNPQTAVAPGVLMVEGAKDGRRQ